jgi:hypothetical protein
MVHGDPMRLANFLAGVLLFLVGIIVLLSVSSCTRGAAARRWRFENTIVLPPGRKLVGVTWKGNDLWTITRPAKPDEPVDEAWHLDEHSSWGFFSGRLILRETAK